jgi:hypothetical protein
MSSRLLPSYILPLGHDAVLHSRAHHPTVVCEEEGIIYAEIDPKQMRGPKWNLDVAGHYALPDVFRLTVNQEGRISAFAATQTFTCTHISVAPHENGLHKKADADSPLPIYYGFAVAFPGCIQAPQPERSPW